jgi:hypothetical protein
MTVGCQCVGDVPNIAFLCVRSTCVVAQVLQVDPANVESIACLASHHFYTDQPVACPSHPRVVCLFDCLCVCVCVCVDRSLCSLCRIGFWYTCIWFGHVICRYECSCRRLHFGFTADCCKWELPRQSCGITSACVVFMRRRFGPMPVGCVVGFVCVCCGVVVFHKCVLLVMMLGSATTV